jgi:FkbM family methyltransferase
MKSIIANLARSSSLILSPLIKLCSAASVVEGAEKYLAFVMGRGSGSGWDADGEVNSIAKFIRSSTPIIFDVGANNGSWSLSLSKKLNKNAKFFLFECAPYCFPGLDERLPLIENVTLFKHAISDKRGSTKLFITTVGSGCGSLHARKDVGIVDYKYTQIEVQTKILDEVFDDLNLVTIDFLKMDIEGHEYSALLGASDLLGSNKILSLSFEFGSANVNSRTFFRDFWDLLTGKGYMIYRIIPGGGVVRVEVYSEQLEYFRGATNYIATLIDDIN